VAPNGVPFRRIKRGEGAYEVALLLGEVEDLLDLSLEGGILLNVFAGDQQG
jgi:hypothetical protein